MEWEGILTDSLAIPVAVAVDTLRTQGAEVACDSNFEHKAPRFLVMFLFLLCTCKRFPPKCSGAFRWETSFVISLHEGTITLHCFRP